ncbi:hypothetical protein KAT63_05115 [Candidatus Parcubacteria bacterium]|nr:hypothetical protein [Candidatus Parcubacteria bacterium]
MNTFIEDEIKEVNEMLHKVLGFDWTNLEIYGSKIMFEGECFLGKKTKSDYIERFDKDETLDLLKNCSDVLFLDIFRFLNFYYPRWIAFNVIKESDDKYAEFSSNNELLIALTSIIDRISNTDKEKNWFIKIINKFRKKKQLGYTRKFVNFLNNNLSNEDIEELIKNAKVYKKHKRKNIKNIDDLAKYIYKIRSLVVHEAELGGIYPHCVSFDFGKKKIENLTPMIVPKNFRRLLWKAIFNHLGLKIIY